MTPETKAHIEYCFRQVRITDELSHSTIIKYMDSIRKFFSVIDKPIEKLEPGDFEEFIISLKDGGAENARICNVISAMRWLIKKLQKDGRIPRTLDVERIKNPRIHKKETVYLTEDEIRAFLYAIENDTSKGKDIRKYRFKALAMFLLQTGARLGEALSVKIGDIDRKNMELKVIGKGSKPRTLYLTDTTIQCIDKYLAMRKDDCKFLFVTLNGQSVWEQTDIGRTFRRYKKSSGIEKQFTLHTLRHTNATHFLLRGMPINIVQAILGHNDPQTTLRYYTASVTNEIVKKTLKKNHYSFIPSLKTHNKPPLLSQPADCQQKC